MIRLTLPRLHLGSRLVLHDIDLTLRPGELTVLAGPNGAGKTTLLRALAGLLPGTPPRDPRHLAYVPQGAASAWGMTVEEIAALGRLPHGDTDAVAIDDALAACGITALRTARMDRISGGQARRAMLARAFATRAGTLLLDEPTADLDPAAAHEVMDLLARTARAGVAVVAVLHAIDLACIYADRLLLLESGRITADGPPAAGLPALSTAFGLPLGVDPRPRLLPPP